MDHDGGHTCWKCFAILRTRVISVVAICPSHVIRVGLGMYPCIYAHFTHRDVFFSLKNPGFVFIYTFGVGNYLVTLNFDVRLMKHCKFE